MRPSPASRRSRARSASRASVRTTAPRRPPTHRTAADARLARAAVMRIGKPLEHGQAAVKAFDIPDPFLKFTALGRQIGYAGYLVNDMLIWVRRSGFLSPVQRLIELCCRPTRPRSARSPRPRSPRSTSARPACGCRASSSRSCRPSTSSPRSAPARLPCAVSARPRRRSSARPPCAPSRRASPSASAGSGVGVEG